MKSLLGNFTAMIPGLNDNIHQLLFRVLPKLQTPNSKLLLTIVLFGALLHPLKSFSQTIPPPVILCVTTNNATGDVTINWDLPALDPCGPFVAYVLLGATNVNGPYLTIDTIRNQTQNTMVHLGANATLLDWHYFMVTVQDCPGSVSASSDTVPEQVLTTPNIDFVTVEQNGTVRIKWFPISSTQTAGYIIYYYGSDGFGQIIDTVFGRPSDTYIDFNGNPDLSSVAYSIAAFDGCGNTTVFNDSSHHTIFLTATIKACEQVVSMNWTRYLRWSGISAYRIETSLDGSPFNVAQSFPDGSYGYDFGIGGIVADTICFRVSALRQGDNIVSNSNIICFPFNLTRSTAYNYLRNVSVSTTGEIDMEWYVDASADINTYIIERSTDGNNFATIHSTPVTTPVFLNPYTDATAAPSSNSYYYRVTSIDDCDISLSSTRGRTILLRGSNNGSLNRLNWNAFELENATVQSYTVYRVQSGTLVPDTTVSPATLTHDDFIATDLTGDGSFCYVVEATFNLDIPGLVNETLSSSSNQLCLYPPPVIFVPNAFVPGGKNNIFKPTFQNPNVSEYEFLIFDRWGKKLFETGIVNAGWDGFFNGEQMPLGGYAYYIRVVSPGGVTAEKKGTVVLVR